MPENGLILVNNMNLIKELVYNLFCRKEFYYVLKRNDRHKLLFTLYLVDKVRFSEWIGDTTMGLFYAKKFSTLRGIDNFCNANNLSFKEWEVTVITKDDNEFNI